MLTPFPVVFSRIAKALSRMVGVGILGTLLLPVIGVIAIQLGRSKAVGVSEP